MEGVRPIFINQLSHLLGKFGGFGMDVREKWGERPWKTLFYIKKTLVYTKGTLFYIGKTLFYKYFTSSAHPVSLKASIFSLQKGSIIVYWDPSGVQSLLGC